MTKEKVARELGIADVGRLKVWMRRYNQMGDSGLTDTRGKRKEYIDENRYVKRLEMENAVLKSGWPLRKRGCTREMLARRRAARVFYRCRAVQRGRSSQKWILCLSQTKSCS
ncbi:helix-turn-helix domain-containing protein [Paenibacillus agilis]|uniref:Helix-turn-helix domain-containing protein n=1 Tax=Paenibacillus agilis TaxID=3020863 RepID=A0A559IZP5_9BACL|nr:helix-turn-helix domain-containing protein [Paenibacillus agilis]